jgi:D-serine deaminase-like pyridoxal phosphate-dependent protein
VIEHETLSDRYARYSAFAARETTPFALIDLDAIDFNVTVMRARSGALPIRIATKSVRCVQLLRYLQERLGDRARGFMCYTAREAEHLSAHGLDDLFVAYPSVQAADIAALVRLQGAGRLVRIAIDCDAHAEALSRAAIAASVPLRVVVDIDTALRVAGVSLGAKRSPLYGYDEILGFVERVRKIPGLQLDGLMAYEAHIAGMTDDAIYARLFKALATRSLRKRRRALAAALPGILFNGAGTGSVHDAASETALTEVTVGSGFIDSHLFDRYRGLRLAPAACYALSISRVPRPGYATALGGGYIASGAAEHSRLPIPYLPEGMRLDGREGAGEVQTPLTVRSALSPGAPVFFRHAKAGELAEHVSEYVFIRGREVVERVPTYRGEGVHFL